MEDYDVAWRYVEEHGYKWVVDQLRVNYKQLQKHDKRTLPDTAILIPDHTNVCLSRALFDVYRVAARDVRRDL